MTRSESFGQNRQLSCIDRLGVWLSTRKVRSLVRKNEAKSVADIGCGFEARLFDQLAEEIDSYVAVDISLSPHLLRFQKLTAIVGELPGVTEKIPSESVDFIVINSVLEHLDSPLSTLRELRRILKNGGTLFVNAPTWTGKTALEFSAFRLSLSPATEINDHRDYFSKKDLWRLVRAAGFVPSEINVKRHKLGLNVYAVCRKVETI